MYFNYYYRAAQHDIQLAGSPGEASSETTNREPAEILPSLWQPAGEVHQPGGRGGGAGGGRGGEGPSTVLLLAGPQVL